MSTSALDTLDFLLPHQLEAHEPPEVRGHGRDDVRLMVSHISDESVTHAHFGKLPDFLGAGDLLVVNSSATINAAFDAMHETRSSPHESVRVHLSTPLRGRRWVIELRRLLADGTTLPLLNAERDERIRMPGGARAILIAPFVHSHDVVANNSIRLWEAELSLPSDVLTYGEEFGFPIRYSYIPRRWPLSFYQTVFAIEPGSAEMPSAARPFTWEMINRLTSKSVRIAPIVLHAGVASLEADELPYPERYRVPHATAKAVNEARDAGGRVVAVGTTVVRALETAASPDGHVSADEGWTDLVVTPARGLYAVDAILTGLHAPRASHLSMLEAFAGQNEIAAAYAAAIDRRYLWHEFGDLHLILPN